MKGFLLFLLSLAGSTWLLAQESTTSTVNVTKTTSSENGTTLPWLWIVGGIALVLLLVALLRGRSGADRVVEKRTIIKE